MGEYKIPAAETAAPSGDVAESRTSAFHSINLGARTVEKSPTLKKFSLLLVAAFSFILPVAFWGTTAAYSVKMGILLIADALLLCAFIVSLFSERKIVLPKTRFIIPLLLIPLGLTLSSLFSGSFVNSFFGNTVEVGTAASFLVLGMLFLGSLYAFSRFKPHALLAKAYLASTAIMLVHFFAIVAMYRGWFSPINNFPILLSGSYIDLSVLLAVAVLISVFVLKQEKRLRAVIPLWALSILSLLVIGSVGSRAVAIALALALLLDYLASRKIGKLAAASFCAAAIFAIFGSNISAPLSSVLKINSLDIKPSLSATANIVLNQWKHNAITGAGPNRFAELWAMYKPVSINYSDFWGQDFFFGSSAAATMAATGGIIFLLFMLGFAIFFVVGGVKALRAAATADKTSAIGSFLVSALLWSFFFVYNPGITVLALAFVSTALFAQSLVSMGEAQYSNFNLTGAMKTVLLAIFALMLVAGAFMTEILGWRKIQAADIFAKTLANYQKDGELAKAEAGLVRANTIAHSDLYDRTLSNVYNIDVGNKIASLKTEATEDQKTALQGEVNAAVAYAKLAIVYNPSNYTNYLAEAKVYEQLAYQNVPGALESAQTSYAEAEKRNPSNPSIQLALARLAALKGDVDKAREYADKSAALKPNYAPAFYFLAQLEAAVNNVPKAISNVEKAAASDPTNAGLHFQLGLIKYNVKDFKGAAAAFENALKIIPDYANAKYFLGLSYYYDGDKEAALKQFQEVQKTNPDNAEVKLILENLQAGRDPFTSAKPPIDNKPGKRKTPPIE